MRFSEWISRGSDVAGVIDSPEAGRVAVTRDASFTVTHSQQTWIAAGVLLLILSTVFFPFVWGKKTLLSSSLEASSIMPGGAFRARGKFTTLRLLDPGAAAWQLEPSFALTHHEYFAEKNLPYWDPYRAFGTPFAATMQAQPFYPLTMLLSLHPGPKLHALFIVCRLFLAGIFGYLFFRLFLSFFPSLAGAVSLMLSGYFILYINISYLSVDVLIAAVFYSIERLLREPALKTTLLVAGVFFLTVVGGMPETTFLLWCYGYSYAVFRVATSSQFRSHWISRAKALALGSAMGAGWSALLILPFLELMRNSFDIHQFRNVGTLVGLTHFYLHGPGYVFLRVLGLYLAPLLQGPPLHNIFDLFSGSSGVQGYFGVISFALAVLAVFVTFRNVIRRRLDSAVLLGIFFSISSVLFWMKKFGSVAVNWIGYLPLFNLINFAKYIEVLQAMAIAALAAIGCSYLLDRRLSAKWIVAAVGTVSAALAVLLIDTFPLLQRPKTVNGYFFYINIVSTFGILLLMVLVVLCFREGYQQKERSWSTVAFGSCIVLLIAGELSLNFLVPLYYIFNRPAAATPSAYSGGPYIDFLQSKAGLQWRVFGRNGFLHPNWSEAFGLFDVRSLDAMYYNRYFHFVRFFLANDANTANKDLANRFTGFGPYQFDTERQLRFLELGSVRYLLASEPFVAPTTLIGQLLHQDRDQVQATPRVGLHEFTINGETKVTLLEHPPYERLPLHVSIPEKKPVLRFSIGLDSAVYAPPICGGGVTFRIEARDGRGEIRKLYSKYIDPKHNLADRRWFPEQVDLSRFRGQSIDLLFSTDGGNNTCKDWSGWADMRIEGQPVPAAEFTKVYDKEVKIYQFDPVLPRTAVFHKFELVGDEAALPRLVDPQLNIFDTVVISANTLTASDGQLMQEIRTSPDGLGQADITHYDSQHVIISATLDKPGILVLNDSAYPGWKAYVDGHPTDIVKANYLFRGVLLPAGRHTVEFKYQPMSVRLGLLISSLSLLGAFIAVARGYRRKLI